MDSVFIGKPLRSAMFNQVDEFWITVESADCDQVQRAANNVGCDEEFQAEEDGAAKELSGGP